MLEIHSENEWSPLRSVIVGDATHANWPASDPVFHREMSGERRWTETEFEFGPVKQEIIDSANQSLDNFSNVLRSLDVEVHRPLERNYQKIDQFYGYCPRDTVLVIGKHIIRTPTPYASRRNEWETFLHVFQGHDVIKPGHPDVLFDAANICRLGQDVLYLVSSTGNLAGAHWLQEFLGKEYRVHILDNIYQGIHIDSTITPVREGLVVLNAGRVNEDNIPEPLKSWDKIWIHEDDLEYQDFVHYPYASNWIGLNFLSINEELCIIDPKQKVLAEKLRAHGIETIGAELPQSRTLGGGHHCVTLDVLRR